MAWLSGWKNRKSLTINASDVDSDVTDFHYLVYLDSSNFNFGAAQSNGYDIRFTSSDGTLLNYFREKHDSTNQIAIYHIKIPLVSSSQDTTIYMYYGNTAASDGASTYTNVFNNQVAYYPFDGNANDLSGNYNGTWHGTEQYATGALGQGAKFDGSNYITMGNWLDTVSSSGKITFSFGVKDSDSRDQTLWSTNSLESANSLLISINNLQYWDSSSHNNSISSSTINNGIWHNIVGLVDTIDNLVEYYEDTTHLRTLTPASGSSILNSSPMYLGCRSVGYYQVNGIIDQVRIYNTALSSTQVSLLYKMESKTLFTFGAEEKLTQTVSGTLYDKNGNAMTAACPVFAIDKDTGDLLGSTTSNTDGTFTIDVTAESGTKVLFVTDYTSTYNGDTDIAGAWLDTVQ